MTLLVSERGWLGDFLPGDYIEFHFNTTTQCGVMISFGGSPAVRVIKTQSTTQNANGVDLRTNCNSITGLHTVGITTSVSSSVYAGGCDYMVMLTCGMVANQIAAGSILATFSLQNRADAECTTFAAIAQDVWNRPTRTITGASCDVYGAIGCSTWRTTDRLAQLANAAHGGTSATFTLQSLTVAQAAGGGDAVTFTGGAASGATPGGSGLTVTGGAASTTGGGTAGIASRLTGGAGAASTNGAAAGFTVTAGGTTTVSGCDAMQLTGSKDGAGLKSLGGSNNGRGAWFKGGAGGGTTANGFYIDASGDADSLEINHNGGVSSAARGLSIFSPSTGFYIEPYGSSANAVDWIGAGASGGFPAGHGFAPRGGAATTGAGNTAGRGISALGGASATSTNGAGPGLYASSGANNGAGGSDGIVGVAGASGVDIRGGIHGNICGTITSISCGAMGAVGCSVWRTVTRTLTDVTQATLACDAFGVIAHDIVNAPLARLTGCGRDVGNALRFLRNRGETCSGVMTIYKEDDSSTAWTSALTTSGGTTPVTGWDPA